VALVPLNIKLRCTSWAQLSTIYKRDLSRGALFLRSPRPPAVGTMVKIDMTLPSESMIVLSGVIVEHVGEGGMDGRGPGVDIKLATIPQSAMWMIETALASHRPPPEPGKAAGGAARAPSTSDAGLDDSADLANAETELVAALGAELKSLQKLNAFQVLGVGYEAGDNEVRGAFGELTRRYHPDRYAKYPSLELRRLAAEIFILIRDAYRKIDNDAGRQKELAVLGRSAVPRAVPSREPSKGHAPPPLPPRTGAIPKIVAKSPTPALGVPMVSQPIPKLPTPALGVPIVTPPVTTSPDAGPPTAATTLSARAQSQPIRAGTAGEGKDLEQGALDALLDQGKYDEALALCRAAIARNANDRVARGGIELGEGLRALEAKDRLEAAQRFEVVLEIDPSNERAARELAEMRRVATNERKGLLTRLLGKKE
jgi:hypothetical protein